MKRRLRVGIWLATPAVALSLPGVAQAAQPQDGGGPDILPLALATMGSIFAAAAIGLALYFLRLRLGFWLHRPPEANPDRHEEEQ